MKKILLLFSISIVMSLNIKAQTPIAAFTTTITCDCPPTCTITFDDLSSSNPQAWYWNFDDGLTTNMQNPTHVYCIYGTFNVTLIVFNSYGSDTVSCIIVSDTSGCHACSTITGINLLPIGNNIFTIIPNPAQDIITIKGTALKSYTIIDMLGRKYKEAVFADASQNTIYVGDLPKGMYFVQVKTQSRSSVRKVIIQ